MANRVRDLLLRITGDPSDAEAALHEVAREMAAFGRLEAEATADVNTKPADAALAKVTADVKKFGQLTATAKVDLQVAGAEAQLERLKKRLENLRKQDNSPKIDIQVAKTIAQIERVEAKIAQLGRRKVEVDVDVKRGAIERISGALSGALGAALGAAGGAGRGITGAIGGVAGAVSGITPLFRGLAVVLGVLLAPALLAVAASAVAAAGALAALGAAFAFAMGPVVLVAVAAFARLAKVLQAVKENKDKVAASGDRVRDSEQRQAAAAKNLAQAQEQARDAAVEGYRAQAQAAEDVSDAIRGIAQAELSRDQANLNYKQAVQNLKELRQESGTTSNSLDNLFEKFTDVSYRPKDLIGEIRKSGIGAAAGGAGSLDVAQGILDVRSADLARKDAIDGVSDAHTRLNEAQERSNEFAREGIEAYEPYKQALENVEDATDGVRDATEKLTTARRDHHKALKELNPQERNLADVIEDVQAALTKAFRPATDRIFTAVIRALKDVADFAKDSRVRGGLTNIGDAIGDVIDTFAKLLQSRGFREGFREFADGAARMIRALGGRAFRDFVTIAARLARATLPALLDLVDKIADKFEDWEKGTREGRKVRGIVDRLLESFEKWRGLIRAVARLIGALFPDAKKAGDSLLGSLTDKLNDWAKWMEKHPEEVKKFFRDVRDTARRIGTNLETVFNWLDKIVTAAGDVKKAIEDASKALGDFSTKELPGTGGDVGEGVEKGAKTAWWLLRHLPGSPAIGRAAGGPVPGHGSGDIVPAMLEPGEYVLRRSVAQTIGLGRLNALNAGRVPGFAAGGPVGMTINEQIINLPPAPGHDQLGDPRHQAAMFARELARRGQGSVNR